MDAFLVTFYMAFPAFGANITPLLGKHWGILKSLDRPLDGGRAFRGKRLLGNNKTQRGLILGTAVGAFIGLMQYFFQHQGMLEAFDFDQPTMFLLYGVLGGFGALTGDAVESFFKRQIGIESGRPFLPFDQIDYILGFWLFTSPLVDWTSSQILFLLICGLVLNPLTNVIGYLTGIKDTYW